MKRQLYLRLPGNIDRDRRKRFLDGDIRHVSTPGCRQAAVQGHVIARRQRKARAKLLCRAPRGHRVAAGRPMSDAEQLAYGFHRSSC